MYNMGDPPGLESEVRRGGGSYVNVTCTSIRYAEKPVHIGHIIPQEPNQLAAIRNLTSWLVWNGITLFGPSQSAAVDMWLDLI